jgi:hypothetical protein
MTETAEGVAGREQARGVLVWSTGHKDAGRLTGGSRRCALEGCRGVLLGVRWPDGELTWPCTRGMTWDNAKGEWEIR